MRRVRRPLLALIALVVAFAIGYGVRALNSHRQTDDHHAPSPSVSSTGRHSAVPHT